ncbi:hypothetical protein ASF49_01030 [Methylobacterium sp. Leaf104]|uniref:VCBS domain-containing protein n=1 Tax=Methylobacterium TaxID=407 RepID=UPI0006F71477|nr:MULTISPECIES: VCBS domain-containing protein [Methylobacterium]KQP42471.1 hypothetical protein ASF49_01030 [Methylobacterium sp. Leaf104]MCI9878997.1 VCBS domain-containing protein [Methylobacterium goesingense]
MATFNGSNADDTYLGGNGDDNYNLGEGNNRVIDLVGRNVINAGSGNDQITTGAGDDQINAGDGLNVIDAGAGNNTINVGSGADRIVAGAGNDQINAGEGDNTVDAGDGRNQVNAGSGNDTIVTGSGDDQINAGEGNNVIRAGDGRNTINTGSGADRITAGSGDDQINAGEGNNVIDAGGGSNRITAGSGHDVITAGSGNNEIYAGEGNNTITVGNGLNRIYTGSGADVITTGSGNDTIYAGGGNDRVILGGGSDLVYLGDGNDVARLTLAQSKGGAHIDLWGEGGSDTLQLVLTAAEAQDAAVLADLQGFQKHLAGDGNWMYQFKTADIAVRQFEKLEIVAPVLAAADKATTTEDVPVTIQVLANDKDLLAASNTALHVTEILASGLQGTATISQDGKSVVYDPGQAFQYLKAGEQADVTFQYKVADDQGFVDTASVTVTVTGVDDVAAISGKAVGAVKEDGVLKASGTLAVSDLDAGQNHFADVSASALHGTYGDFTFNDGAWDYTLRNGDANVQALATGQTVYDTLTVNSQDGTASQQIKVSIAGQDEPAKAGNLLVTFEDVPGTSAANNQSYGDISNYKGFKWDSASSGSYEMIAMHENYGYSGVANNSQGSGSFVGLNNYFGATPTTISRADGADFEFQSGYFADLNLQNSHVDLQGFNNGVLVGEKVLDLGRSTKVEVDWGHIDQLVLNHTGGSGILVMDDLLFMV